MSALVAFLQHLFAAISGTYWSAAMAKKHDPKTNNPALCLAEQESRMKLNLMFVAGALALAMGTQARAADLPPVAPAPRAPVAYVPMVSPAYNWSGFYIGINGGYAFGNSTWTAPGLSSGGFSVDGGQAGGTIGFNYQTGPLVLGLEGDFDWQNVRGAASGTVCPSCDTASNWIGTFRGRVGYAFDRVLVYGTAGGAVTDIKASVGAFPWGSSTELGWSAGAGVEMALTDNWTAKAEYLFADFEKASCAVANCGYVTPPSVSLYENQVRFGVNYKFGGY
jgi:outer membrane immunogenic protein